MTDNTLDKPGMDELDLILHELDTKLHHADKSIFMDTAVNEGAKAIKEAKDKLKDREKQMLEYFIGEDEDNSAYSQPGMYEINERNKKNAIRNGLKTEQRQRAKEWEKR